MQRIRQGIRALLAFAYAVDYDLAAQYLTEAQLALFKQMGRSEQLHSLNVLRSVLAQADQTPHDLALAALLHDVGKGRAKKLTIWQKTISVVFKKILPALNTRLSAEKPLTFWNTPFVVRRWHPKWSAEILTENGASDCAIWLARHHADEAEDWLDHPYHALLLRLQQADDEN